MKTICVAQQQCGATPYVHQVTETQGLGEVLSTRLGPGEQRVFPGTGTRQASINTVLLTWLCMRCGPAGWGKAPWLANMVLRMVVGGAGAWADDSHGEPPPGARCDPFFLTAPLDRGDGWVGLVATRSYQAPHAHDKWHHSQHAWHGTRQPTHETRCHRHATAACASAHSACDVHLCVCVCAYAATAWQQRAKTTAMRSGHQGKTVRRTTRATTLHGVRACDVQRGCCVVLLERRPD